MLNSKLDMIKSKTFNVEHLCLNVYDTFVNKVYIFHEDRLNLYRSWIKTAERID
jgi:hypothetical protein